MSRHEKRVAYAKQMMARMCNNILQLADFMGKNLKKGGMLNKIDKANKAIWVLMKSVIRFIHKHGGRDVDTRGFVKKNEINEEMRNHFVEIQPLFRMSDNEDQYTHVYRNEVLMSLMFAYQQAYWIQHHAKNGEIGMRDYDELLTAFSIANDALVSYKDYSPRTQAEYQRTLRRMMHG